MVPGLLAFVMAGISLFRPNFLLGNGSTPLGLLIVRWLFSDGGWVMAGWCSCRSWWNASMLSGRASAPSAWCRAAPES
jgi:hypothetical protein